MNATGVHGLIADIEVAFGLPALGLILVLINIRFSPRSNNALKLRLSLIFLLLLFAISLSTMIIQDRDVLKVLWQGNPILYSLVYLLSGALVVAGVAVLVYWKLRPELWRGNGRESAS